jgi:hypothetical protein
MALKIIQKLEAIDIASPGGVSTSAPISMKTGYIRIVPTLNCYIDVGPSPGINTASSLFVPANTETVLKEEWGSKGFVGIVTGSTTTIIFPEGTGGGFIVGDVVSISGCSPVGLTTNFATVISVDNRTSFDSYHNTRLTLDFNTSSVSSVVNPEGELRKVTRVAAYNAGSGTNKIHITEIQVNSYS